MTTQFLLTLTIVLTLAAMGFAQIATGGPYALEQAVVANGGGNSGGGIYAVHGTAGQAAAGGNGTAGSYGLRGGFWHDPPLAPSAATVTISGRVLRDDGLGIRNVRVTITGMSLTSPRTALTGSLGYFTFEDIEAGQSYVVTISSKRYGFAQPSQILTVTDNVTDLIFTSTWQN